MSKTPSHGTCALCGARAEKQEVLRHLRSCTASRGEAKGPPELIFQMRAESSYDDGTYWLDLDIKAKAKLTDLDFCLRRLWLECCGHLSAFYIGGATYMSYVDASDPFSSGDRHMNVKLSDVVGLGRKRFRYEYDFGSMTALTLKVRRVREGVIGRSPVRVLARNDPPLWPCAGCGKPATQVCSYCLNDADPFFCDAHAPEHPHATDEVFLPVVNSPRIGTCGYTG